MAIKPRIIRDYVTPDGHEPFEEWLDSLRDKKTQAILRWLQKNTEAGHK